MRLLKSVVVLIIPVIVLFGFTMFFAFGDGVYLKHIDEKNLINQIDLPQNELPRVVSHITSYIKGTNDDFSLTGKNREGQVVQVFGQREIDHMKDVKVLFDYVKWITILGLIVILVYFKRILETDLGILIISNVLFKSGVLSILTSMIISVLVVVNFDKYFTKFHEVVFSNDLWLLNPKTDVLIQILPITFFIDITMKILLFSMGTMFFISALGMVIRDSNIVKNKLTT